MIEQSHPPENPHAVLDKVYEFMDLAFNETGNPAGIQAFTIQLSEEETNFPAEDAPDALIALWPGSQLGDDQIRGIEVFIMNEKKVTGLSLSAHLERATKGIDWSCTPQDSIDIISENSGCMFDKGMPIAVLSLTVSEEGPDRLIIYTIDGFSPQTLSSLFENSMQEYSETILAQNVQSWNPRQKHSETGSLSEPMTADQTNMLIDFICDDTDENILHYDFTPLASSDVNFEITGVVGLLAEPAPGKPSRISINYFSNHGEPNFAILQKILHMEPTADMHLKAAADSKNSPDVTEFVVDTPTPLVAFVTGVIDGTGEPFITLATRAGYPLKTAFADLKRAAKNVLSTMQ